MGGSRGRDGHDQHDDHSRSRHAYRSRQDGSDGRDRTDPYDEGSDDGYDRPYRSPPQSLHRDRNRDRDRDRDRSKNGWRTNDWDDEQTSYDHMYDDGHGRPGDGRSHGRYDDYASRGAADFAHSDRSGRSRSPRDRRYRSRSRSRTRDAGKPTDTVILEGLPHSITTTDLREGLLVNSVAAEFPSIDVRISSSKGKRRAFVQFDQVSHATAFIKEHFPKLYLELRNSTDDVPDGKFEAYIHFARSRGEEGDSRPPRAADWTCPQCDFSNFASRVKCKVCGAAPAAAPSLEQSLTGAADVADGADAVSQILVVHPLASFVTEDMLAKDLKLLEKTEEAKSSANGPTKLKSTAPGADSSRYGAKPNSLHRVFLTREVNSGESFKYGFAEFWTLEDAAAAVTKFRMSRSFSVAGCAVTVAPTHMGVFLPEDREITPANEHMSFHPLFNPSLRVRYRDLRVFPSQMVVTSEPPTKNANMSTLVKSSAEDQDAEAKKQKKRKADGSLAPSSSSNKRPVVMAGQMAVWQRKQDELRADQGDKSSCNNSNNVSSSDFVPRSDASKAPIKISLSNVTKLGAPPQGESQPVTTAISRVKGSAPTTATVASSGDSWTVRASSSTDDNVRDESQENGSNTNSKTKEEETYVDRERLMCLICMRKYKSTDEVKIHEKSRNHKTAMEDGEKVKAAQPRIAARDKRLQRQAEEESQMPQYRDRAKERRDIYNQPDRPAGPPAAAAAASSSSSSTSTTKPRSEGATKSTDQAAKAGPSKGAGMLAKMGWTSGAGLGANGDGRTEAIATNAYQAGVGLGAAGGNLGDAVELAEKKTTNKYSDYLTTVQDKARERYNQLS
ncbi:hypothetical protein E4U42_005159 [Claviceps africana]|uniref:RNA-binding protein n=1 Tax=Claviceps africana TaxID=83212 RepID=A0A8K0J531_9HYPO|nr:hypothetical protein E4U42_005159 [Claviceps africana]